MTEQHLDRILDILFEKIIPVAVFVTVAVAVVAFWWWVIVVVASAFG